MNQTPVRIPLHTLGDLLEQRSAGMIGGLEAWCYSRSCDVASVPLDLDRLTHERGSSYDWKRLKAVCKACGGSNTAISLRWSHTDSSTPGAIAHKHTKAVK